MSVAMQPLKQPDFFLWLRDGVLSVSDSTSEDVWFDLKSITKLFVVFCLHGLAFDFDASVVEFFESYGYDDVTIKSIVNHSSGLEATWVGSQLFEDYCGANNLQAFVLDLKKTPGHENLVVYNNYAYEILGCIIAKVTGKNWDEHLEKFFPNVRFKAGKRGSFSYCSHSLMIHKDDITRLSHQILATKYHSILRGASLNFSIFDLSGHSGSGGQFLLFSDEEVFWILSAGDSDSHQRGLTRQEVNAFICSQRSKTH